MPRVSAILRLLCVALIFAPGPRAVAEALPDDFTAALQGAGIPLSRVAVVVQALDAAVPILSHNADAALNPASVMKLVTSFAALERLGPDYVWTTRVWADGPVVDGVLQGNLVIAGRGDPTLTLERIWLLQRSLRAQGIRHIAGGLVLDTTYFDVPQADPGAFDDERFALYNAPAGALVANFNAVTLRVKPGADEVLIVPDVAMPGVSIRSRVAPSDAAECNGMRGALVPALTGERGTELVITGRYPRACGERSLSLSLFEPAATFDRIFRGLWAETGGTLAGATVAGTAPPTEPLLVFASEPLPAALTRQNKFSNNLMTRNLFLTLGAEAYGPPATLEKGARAVREALERRGIPTQKLVLENGAGLSRIERISAQALTELLRAAHRSSWFPEFAASLPVVGIDGTLKRRFNGSALAGQAHLKTGTLRDVSALAGYVHGADGRRMSLVLMVYHTNARQAEAAQRALLEWVSRYKGHTE
ncbi:MAG: D-alanyl-D-alanine carboxypeptidase/D-alanyl-D-alanine-endopeptidase [Thiobacillus sp.]